MLVCSYCGRHFKHDYESCPGCGSGSFKKINDTVELVIDTPPKDGYHISTESYSKEKSNYKIIKIFLYIMMGIIFLSSLGILIPLIIFILIGIMSLFGSIDIEGIENIIPVIIFLLLFFVSDIIFGCGFLYLIKYLLDKQRDRADNNIVRVNKLAKEGMLIKNMPYELVESGNVIMGKPIYCIKINFKFENGTVLPLISNPKFDGVDMEKEKSVDLLIDKNDYKNYYIDYEIY